MYNIQVTMNFVILNQMGIAVVVWVQWGSFGVSRFRCGVSEGSVWLSEDQWVQCAMYILSEKVVAIGPIKFVMENGMEWCERLRKQSEKVGRKLRSDRTSNLYSYWVSFLEFIFLQISKMFDIFKKINAENRQFFDIARLISWNQGFKKLYSISLNVPCQV